MFQRVIVHFIDYIPIDQEGRASQMLLNFNNFSFYRFDQALFDQ
ncbi:hypothetical protein SAMN04488511_101261 [Pedobacter suwonensis]|uniref:Uncharacterized protein n=1 Tax=Pedobacter suwonensis TaxID=332999 RepID=A0A1I0SGQ5_9SPHI|nr:hypothetical protein SAMN04488511_101261 [Pedobacter suwonensis]